MKLQNTPIRNIVQLLLIVFTGAALSADVHGQCKTFKLSDSGDTLNCTDIKNKKQGKWVERTNPLRGAQGFDEEGEYINNRKEGLWRKYNLQGDILSMENYKWGLQNGISQYFTVDGLEREESWKAMDPDKEYDTIDVPDLYTEGVYKSVIIKNDGYSLKHGKWTYYDPRTGFIQKTENYFRDSSENPLAVFGVKMKRPLSDTAAASLKKKALAAKTIEILDWEKKNAGKKKVKVRDGSTGY
ncbi:MAG: hypothetical protein ABIX01_04035 [Chitinophagaceae bacterium]